jgi:hypothetical protein
MVDIPTLNVWIREIWIFQITVRECERGVAMQRQACKRDCLLGIFFFGLRRFKLFFLRFRRQLSNIKILNNFSKSIASSRNRKNILNKPFLVRLGLHHKKKIISREPIFLAEVGQRFHNQVRGYYYITNLHI